MAAACHQETLKAFSKVGEKSFLSVSPTWVNRKSLRRKLGQFVEGRLGPTAPIEQGVTPVP